MFEKTECHFNTKIDSKEIYDKIFEGKAEKDALSMLTENFVSESKSIITFHRHTLIKHSTNIIYNRDIKTYYATESGYVCYVNNYLSLIPVISVNEEKTKCVAVIPIKDKVKHDLTYGQLMILLHSLKLYQKVKPDLIKEIMNVYDKNKGGVITLLEGIPAVNGKPPIIDLLYNIKVKIGQEDETGRINYKNKNYINNVHKGEVIAKYHPPVMPSIGRDVFGDIIHPRPETTFTYKQGKGLVLDEERGLLLSEYDGILTISTDNEIIISDTKIIEGNVDIAIGNLYVKGHLHIKGDVCNGLEVKTEGNIQIDGNIEESTVWCGQNLTVKGGIIGNDRSSINVKGNCKVSFIRNGNVNCGGDLVTNGSIMHCDIVTQGKIIADHEKRGKIVGGKIHGAMGINVSYVGNNSGVKTNLLAGIDARTKEEIKELKKQSQSIDKIIINHKNMLGAKYFDNPRQFLSKLPRNKILIIKPIIEKLKISLHQKMNLEKKIKSLTEGQDNLKKAFIIIRKCCYEGVVIQINNITKHFNIESTTPGKYIYSEKERDIVLELIDQ